jgi:elongation factor P
MKISGNDLRPGVIIDYKKRLLVTVKTQHVKPGKGPAYMQAELKDIVEGTKINERFRSDEHLERVRLDEKEYQYLYEEAGHLNFMDQVSFEQITLDRELIGDDFDFLTEGMNVTVCTYEEKPVSVRLPDHITMEITEADPVVKGQTAASSYKPAVLENGVRIMVPPHIETGTRVVVDIAERSYVERAKD